jgi:hypothetical protein
VTNAPNAGVPIGNLTSQLFANIYLNELDQYVKRHLRVRHYIRYMDDFVVLASSHEEICEIRRLIETFLLERLKLILSPQKVHIGRCQDGISFVGYRIYFHKIRLRSASFRRIQKKLRKAIKVDSGVNSIKFQSCLASFAGHALYCTDFVLIYEKLIKINKGEQNPIGDCGRP